MRALAVTILFLASCGGRDQLVVQPPPPSDEVDAATPPELDAAPDAPPAAIGNRADAARPDAPRADGGGTLVCVLPACVANLVSACPTTGIRCKTEGNAALGQSHQCYDNGVNVSSTLGLTGAQIAITRADGQPCYSIAGSLLGSSATFEVLDPSGNGVASGQVEQAADGSSKILITCAGAAGVVTLPLDCTPLAGAFSEGSCTAGTCP